MSPDDDPGQHFEVVISFPSDESPTTRWVRAGVSAQRSLWHPIEVMTPEGLYPDARLVVNEPFTDDAADAPNTTRFRSVIRLNPDDPEGQIILLTDHEHERLASGPIDPINEHIGGVGLWLRWLVVERAVLAEVAERLTLAALSDNQPNES